MNWVNALVNIIKPGFGGIITFCVDPDELLDISELREALRAENMELIDWDGSSDCLSDYVDLSDEEKPILITPASVNKNSVDAIIKDNVWHHLSIGGLFNKLAYDIVKSVPREHWDKLRDLNQQLSRPQNAQETALLIARAVYGADLMYLELSDKWIDLIKRISESDSGIPEPVADVISKNPPYGFSQDDLTAILTEPSSARGALIGLKASMPDKFKQQNKSIVIEKIVHKITPKDNDGTSDIVKQCMINQPDSYMEVMGKASTYFEKRVDEYFSVQAIESINESFNEWIKSSYGLQLSAHNSNILRMDNLLDSIDNKYANEKVVFLVIDGLGVAPWYGIKKILEDEKIASEVNTKFALAVIPTLTHLSRRAIFESALPSRFNNTTHSQTLERKLWINRYQKDGVYLTSSETHGINDAYALNKQRICIMDTSWDNHAHHLDPQYEKLQSVAPNWFNNSPLKKIIKNSLSNGYKVIITSDHGQIECTGKGLPKSGELTSNRSKRVLIFNNGALRDNYSSEFSFSFQPSGIDSLMYPLFSKGLFAFDRDGVNCYSHGGISMDEVIVPFAEIT